MEIKMKILFLYNYLQYGTEKSGNLECKPTQVKIRNIWKKMHHKCFQVDYNNQRMDATDATDARRIPKPSNSSGSVGLS